MGKELGSSQNKFKKREPQKNTVYYPLGQRVLWQGHLGMVVGLNVKPYDYPVGYDILVDPNSNLKNPYVTNASFYEVEPAPGLALPEPTYIEPRSADKSRLRTEQSGRKIVEKATSKTEQILQANWVKFAENERTPIVGREPIFKVLAIYQDSRNREMLKLSHPAWQGKTCDLWVGNFEAAPPDVAAEAVIERLTKQLHGKSANEYGRYYWGIEVAKDLSEDGRIYVMADDVQIKEGVLLFVRKKEGSEQVNLAIAPGKWLAVYSASVADGSAVAADRWQGR